MHGTRKQCRESKPKNRERKAATVREMPLKNSDTDVNDVKVPKRTH